MNRETQFNLDNSDNFSIPESFISEHLLKINDPNLLKLLLYIFWRFYKNNSEYKHITIDNIMSDEVFSEIFGKNREDIKNVIHKLLTNAVKAEILINCSHPKHADNDLYFYNSSKYLDAVKLIKSGEIKLENIDDISLALTKPNIFKLYEENIGPLTPLIADTLEDASNKFSLMWIEEAMQIAVENNVRRWNYIQAILSRWQEEGKNARRDQKDSQEDRDKYLKGKFSDLIKS